MTPSARTPGASRSAPVIPGGSATCPAALEVVAPNRVTMATSAAMTPASSPRRSQGGRTASARIVRILHSGIVAIGTPAAGVAGRVVVPDDARDLPGEFRFRRPIEVRFADTDAMGHVNNAAYLT